MDSRNVTLLVILCAAVSLLGCQTVKNNQMLSSSDMDYKIKQENWEKSGELFPKSTDSNLKANESRIVFFRDAEKGDLLKNINIGIGRDNAFQTSLQNEHYSEKIVCNSSQVITASILKENGDVISSSENFQFTPQTTTYLKVDVSKNGRPLIQRISDDEALASLRHSTRQTNQISRVFIKCSVPKPVVIPPAVTVAVQPPAQNLLIRNERQFTVLFDFDSTNITSDTASELGLMADFIKTRRTNNNIVLEGHTDSKGSDVYNNKLSQVRANTAKEILVKKYGIDSMKLTPMGYGESHPVDTNNTDQGRQNNRRVVATVISEQ